jgi:heme oxygenase
MLPLKEAIQQKHSQAEKMPFNQKMAKGELTNQEYLTYLYQLLPIFLAIESLPLPHPSLQRAEAVFKDINEIMDMQNSYEGRLEILPATKEYTAYLSTLNQFERLPHVYLNYLAIMFGGQIMKEKVPGSGKMYDFENMREAMGAVRAIQKDEWADEANKALDFNIAILAQLEDGLTQ